MAAYSSQAPRAREEPSKAKWQPFRRKAGESTRHVRLQAAKDGEGAPGNVG